MREFGNWSAAEDLPEIEKNYLDGVIYNHMPNRSDNCLFFGKLAGNDDTFQLDSGYEAYGISYYYQEVSVDMKEAGVVYCPYAQEYSGWDGGNTVSFEMGPNSGGISEEETEVTYYLNGVFENNNIWCLYGMYAKGVMQPDSEGIYDPAFWPYAMTALEDKIQAAETGGGGKRGTILSLVFEKPARRMGPRSGISMESLSCTIFRRERMMKFPTGRSILRVIRRWRRSM